MDKLQAGNNRRLFFWRILIFQQILKILAFYNERKTTLVHRYIDNEFTPDFISTIGIDMKTKLIQVDGANINLNITDTGGQERFATIVSAYYRNAMGIMLCFDLNSHDSFEKVNKWHEEIKKHATSHCDILLIGCKSDMEHNVTKEEINYYLSQNKGLQYVATSSKTGENVVNAYETLVRKIMHRLSATTFHQKDEDIVKLDDSKSQQVATEGCGC